MSKIVKPGRRFLHSDPEKLQTNLCALLLLRIDVIPLEEQSQPFIVDSFPLVLIPDVGIVGDVAKVVRPKDLHPDQFIDEHPPSLSHPMMLSRFDVANRTERMTRPMLLCCPRALTYSSGCSARQFPSLDVQT